MIHWLLQSQESEQALRLGQPPVGSLSHSERERFEAFDSDKRRQEWLLGRWTAKRLIQSVLEDTHGNAPALDHLVVNSAATGAPQVNWRPPFSLSIGHRDEYAFCALYLQPNIPIGADIERVEPCKPNFDRECFTSRELDTLAAAPAGSQDRLIATIGSAKEAVLKALGIGPSQDLRSVSCLIKHPGVAPTTWQPFDIIPETSLLSRLGSSLPRLQGWWRAYGPNYVLTLAAPC